MTKNNKITKKPYSSRLNIELDDIAIIYNTTPTELIRNTMDSKIESYKTTDPIKREQYVTESHNMRSTIDKIYLNRIKEKIEIINEKLELNEKERISLNRIKKDLDSEYLSLKEKTDNYNEKVKKQRKNRIKRIFNQIVEAYFNKEDIFRESDINEIINYNFEYIHLSKIDIINYIQSMLRNNENKIMKINDYKHKRKINVKLSNDVVNTLCTMLGNCR